MSDRPQVSDAIQGQLTGPTDVSHADLVRNLFAAVLSLCRKIAQGAAHTQHFRCLHNEVERLFLWGECFCSSESHLEEVFSTSTELQQAVLCALYELGKTVREDLFQAVRILIQSEGQGDTLLPHLAIALELQRLLESAAVALDRHDATSDAESLSDEESTCRTLDDAVEDVTTYVDCLMDLSPSLESPLRNPGPNDESRQRVEVDDAEDSIMEMEGLGRAEALELLRGGLKDAQIADTTSTTELLEFLDYQPLAVKQASAYLRMTGISTAAYLDRCQFREKSLVELNSRDFKGQEQNENARNFYAMWLVSLEHMTREMPLAVGYLRYISFLAEENIPKSILPQGKDARAVNQALDTLKAYAFISERNAGSFDVPGPVGLAMQWWLGQQGDLGPWITRMMQKLADTFPFPQHENRELWAAYLPHVQAVLKRPWPAVDPSARADQLARALVLFNAAECCLLLGRYSEAETMHREALALRQKLLGMDHSSTMECMYSLANVLYSQGKYAMSEAMHRNTLASREKVLGRNHQSTLDSMNNLAVVLGSQGKYSEAEEMHRQTSALKAKLLGAEHPSTLDSIDNLALVLGTRGKYHEAEGKHQQTLALRKRIFGPEHPSTLNSMNNLAIMLGSQHKYHGAEEIHRSILLTKQKILPPEHPAILDSMDNLAAVLGSQGKSEEAEQIHRQILAVRERRFGLEHPSTLNSMNNLGVVLGNQERYDEAERIHRQTLAVRAKVLGPEHPATLDSMDNLTIVLGGQRKHEEAEELNRRSMEIRKAKLGEHHPDTLASMHSLASTWRSLGRREDALALMRDCVSARQQVLGPDHPHTLSSVRALGEWG